MPNDGLRTSILGDGCFLAWRNSLPPLISITDEPLQGDHAYQPIHSNGHQAQFPARLSCATACWKTRYGICFRPTWRVRVMIDVARAQSYGSVPVPRMTNIRIRSNAHPNAGARRSIAG